MNLDFEVPDGRISDLISCAFDGGSTYWARIEGVDVPAAVRKDDREIFNSDLPMLGGEVFITAWNDGQLYEHNGVRGFTLDRAACDRGAKIMATTAPRHWGDFMAENEDATTGDVFLQCCLFGEVVFG